MIGLAQTRRQWAPGSVRPRVLSQATPPASACFLDTPTARILSDGASAVPLAALAYRLRKMGMKVPSGFFWMTSGVVSLKAIYDLLVVLGVDIRLGILESAMAQVITDVLGLGSSSYLALGANKASTKMAWGFLSGGLTVKTVHDVSGL